MSDIHVTYDGDTSWLECFKDDPDAENGTIIDPIDAGDEWDGLAAKVAEHQAEHGCAAQPQPAPELGTAMGETRERLDVIEERIGNLAAGLKLSASSSHPSKKSEIEMSVHRALLALLDPR